MVDMRKRPYTFLCSAKNNPSTRGNIGRHISTSNFKKVPKILAFIDFLRLLSTCPTTAPKQDAERSNRAGIAIRLPFLTSQSKW